LIASFEHRFSQLFEEQWDAVRAFNYLVDGLARETRIPGEPLDERGAFICAQPIQCHCSYVQLAAPAVLELGAERN